MAYIKTTKQNKKVSGRGVEKQNSSSTLATEAESVSSASSAGSLARRVRFATTKDGKVKCETKTIKKCSNPALWWQEDEIAAWLQQRQTEHAVYKQKKG